MSKVPAQKVTKFDPCTDAWLSAKFGEWVRKARREKNMSQAKLSELTGLHLSYISSLENGKRQAPSFEKSEHLCRVLGSSFWRALQEITDPDSITMTSPTSNGVECETFLLTLRDQLNSMLPQNPVRNALVNANKGSRSSIVLDN